MYTFSYLRPTELSELASQPSGGYQFLAGGQSLVQAMKLRLAQPQLLVDLGEMQVLQGITLVGSVVRIAAMSTHTQVADSSLVQANIPALAALANGIGDPMVRNQGTVGGSLANADPAACYPSALLALDGIVITDSRRIPASDFFQGLYQTALQEGELITAVEFSIPVSAQYMKLKHPASRFALVGVFVAKFPDGIRVAVTGAKACAYREPLLEQALTANCSAHSLSAIVLSEQGMNADIHCSAQYRAAMVVEMCKRAVLAVEVPR
jgi:aerobic carbon-monoxide dehydrogenase medium subunit